MIRLTCLAFLILSTPLLITGCNSAAQADDTVTSPTQGATPDQQPPAPAPTVAPTSQPTVSPTPTPTETIVTNGCRIAGWANEGNPVQVYSCVVNGRNCVLAAGSTTQLSCQ